VAIVTSKVSELCERLPEQAVRGQYVLRAPIVLYSV
jgi:hypothetical protein